LGLAVIELCELPLFRQETRVPITFHGNWKIDAERSKVWDYKSGRYAPDEVGEELIRIQIDGDIQNYEVLLGDQPTIRMGYTCRYDDSEWVSYTVREILGVTEENSDGMLADFVNRTKSRVTSFRVGAVYGLVRSVYVDERTHYRLSKGLGGAAEYVMLRRLAEDGQSYVATVLGVDGIVTRVRQFVRIADDLMITRDEPGR
jgi:hypothetical protein